MKIWEYLQEIISYLFPTTYKYLFLSIIVSIMKTLNPNWL